MISISGLSKRFGARDVLRDVSFDMHQGETVRLLGANGAGKSTLLRCLLGLIDFDGQIWINGLDPRVDGVRVRSLIGYMPQQNGLHLDLTVQQTMTFYADLRGVDHGRITPLLEQAGLTAHTNARVAELSGGLRQRLAFSVAILSEPQVLVLDEPNASLDTASHAWLAGRINSAAAEGRLVIVSTHLGQSLFDAAPRTLVLDDGRVGAEIPAAAQDAMSIERLHAGTEVPAYAGVPAYADASNRRVPRASRTSPWPLVRKELRDGLRNKWLLGYALILGALGLASAMAGIDSSTGLGLDNVGRTSATLLNLCLLLSPLLAVLMGASAVAGEAERGTLDHLLAQPLGRSQVLLAKHAGLLIALAAATLAGFLPASLLVVNAAGWRAIGFLLLFPALALLAASGMAAIGLYISISSRSAVQAQGTAVLAWFALAIFYDLVLIGVLSASHLPTPMLAATLLANPIDAARVLGVLALEPDLYLLGPAGAFITARFGSAIAAALLMTSTTLWAVLPVVAAIQRFRIPTPRRTRRHEPTTLSADARVRRTRGGDRVQLGQDA